MSIREDIRSLIAKYTLPLVYSELQNEMQETYSFLRSVFEPPRNNLVIPMAETIPNRIATPLHKPISVVLSNEPPQFELDTDEETESHMTNDITNDQTHVVPDKDLTLKEVVIQAKSEMNKQTGEKFSKTKHREDVAKKYKELAEKGIKPESLLTKENLTQWLGSGMSYMRIARELVGVHENEIAAIAKTFGLQSDVKKYIVMKKGKK